MDYLSSLGLCTHAEEEFDDILDPEKIYLDAFSERLELGEQEYPLRSLFKRIGRWTKEGYFLSSESLEDCMRKNLGDYTFLEAYNKTRRILNITVSSSTTFDMPRLLNYLTAPHVVIWSAVLASCAVPSIFKSRELYVKDRSGKLVPWHPTGDTWIDGSVEK